MALGASKQRALLAMLALQANAPVPADRLSEGLWGEQQPASASKMVQLYVSRLRKELDGSDAAIVTRGRGYELRIDPDAVDALCFERCVAAGEASVALALWTGAPLDDVADEPFAADQIRRLEELWLRARELEIDAALEAGDEAAALSEAEALLAEDPFREHVHAQRMLALYRIGRQADALAAYRAARRRLMDEVGIEPGPELRALNDAILAQDPSLGRARRSRPAAPRRRGRVPGAAAALGVIAIAIAMVLVATRSSTQTVAVAPDSVAVIDPVHNRISADIAVQSEPGPIAAAEGRVWVLSLAGKTLTRIDPARRDVVETAAVNAAGSAQALTAVPRSVWVFVGCQEGGTQATVLRLDTTLRPISIPENLVAIPLDIAAERGRHQAPGTGGVQCGLAALGRSIWLATPVIRGLARLDISPPTSPLVDVTKVRPLPFVPPVIAVGMGSLWVRDPRENVIWRMDPSSLRRTAVVQAGTDPAAMAVGEGAVWVANAGDDSVSRVDPRSNASLRAISVGDSPSAIAIGAGAVWVANRQDGTVSRIAPDTNRVVATIKVGHRPEGIAFTGGSVWVTVHS
ncbi:MAG TPA: BTAD domain-containing putative transcriptional regulator [Solirubrobacteraceae bacterium]|nr:BTAD domain-containing putative transcriptional regulator [Solirubrobacteraceae bacterium]